MRVYTLKDDKGEIHGVFSLEVNAERAMDEIRRWASGLEIDWFDLDRYYAMDWPGNNMIRVDLSAPDEVKISHPGEWGDR